MIRYILIIFAGLLIILPQTILAIPVVLDSVPSYSWYHGCGPTASGSIMGFWDLHGYDDLFDASGSDVMLTVNVREHISSTAHNEKYDPRPDNIGPAPPDTSLADFWHTSEGGLQYGWSYTSYMDNAHEDYASYRGYNFESRFIGRSWENLVTEVNSGNPLIAYVDSNGDGSADHFIPIFGYDDRQEDGLWYASYNTWHEDETIDWYQWRSRSNEYIFGVESIAYVHPLDDPIGGLPIRYIDFSVIPEPQPGPVLEPSTLILVGFGLISIVGYKRKKL